MNNPLLTSLSFTLTASAVSLFSFGSLVLVRPSQAAILNGSFESGLDNWESSGDVSLEGAFDGGPTDENFQVLLTTASTVLQDDQPEPAGTFNFSGNNPANENSASELEDFLGLTTGKLDDFVSGPFEATEGSAIKQSFTAQAGERLSFDWNFLTNDGEAPSFGGPRDYAFVTLDQVTPSSNLTPLANSTSASLGTSTTIFSQETGFETFTSLPLAAGDYVLGIGIVDGAGTDKTSALLVDNVKLSDISSPPPSSIPEPSSVLGLLGLGIGGTGLLLKGQGAKNRENGVK